MHFRTLQRVVLWAPVRSAGAQGPRGWREVLVRRRVVVSAVALVAFALFVILAFLVDRHAGVVDRIDQSVHGSLRRYGQDHPLWLSAMRTLTHLGDTITVVVVDVAVFAFCVWRSRPRAALFVAVVGLGAGAVRIVVREVVARPRPVDALWPADGLAFPSGHTTNAAAMMAIIVGVCWPVLRGRGRTALVIVASIAALAVGLSRIAGAVHWTSDVVGGLLSASAVVCAALAWLPPGRTRSGEPEREVPSSPRT